MFPMRCDTAPFNNKDVRLALKYAIDREKIVKAVLRGYGRIGNDQPIPSYDPFFAADIPQRPYDPDKARFHINQAGYNGPIELHVSDGAFDGSVAAAQVFQVDAAKAGISVNIIREPADGYWDNVWMKKAFCASYWSGRPTADLMFSVAYKSDAAWNETFWKNSKFDTLLVAARTELDVDKRKQMYHDLEMLVSDDCGELIPMFNNFLDGAVKGLKGFKPNPAYELGAFRAPRHVWLEFSRADPRTLDHDQAVDHVNRRSMSRIMARRRKAGRAAIALEVTRQAAVAAGPKRMRHKPRLLYVILSMRCNWWALMPFLLAVSRTKAATHL